MKTESLIVMYLVFQIALAVVVRRTIRVVSSELGKGEGGVSFGGRTAILRATGISKIAAWMIFLVALILFLVFILDTWGSIEGFSWQSTIAAACLIAGTSWTPWLLILLVYAKAYAVNEIGITRYSPWSRTMTLRWEEVTGIGFIPFYDMFVVKSHRGRILISPLLNNIQDFAQGVIDRVPRKMWKKSDRLIEKASKGPFRPDW